MPLLLPPVYIHLCQGTRVCCTSSVLGSTETSGLVLLSLWSGHCCTLLLCTEVLCSEMTGMWKKKKALGEPCKHPAHHSQGYLANKKLTACHLITKAITPRLAICKRDSKKMQDAFYLTKDEDLHLCLLSWEMLFLSLPWSWEGKGSADTFRIRQALCHPRTGLLFSRLCALWWISLFLWKHFTSAIMLGVSMCPGIQSNSHSEAEQAAWQQNRIPRTVQWASLKEREQASCWGSGKLFNSW